MAIDRVFLPRLLEFLSNLQDTLPSANPIGSMLSQHYSIDTSTVHTCIAELSIASYLGPSNLGILESVSMSRRPTTPLLGILPD